MFCNILHWKYIILLYTRALKHSGCFPEQLLIIWGKSILGLDGKSWNSQILTALFRVRSCFIPQAYLSVRMGAQSLCSWGHRALVRSKRLSYSLSNGCLLRLLVCSFCSESSLWNKSFLRGVTGASILTKAVMFLLNFKFLFPAVSSPVLWRKKKKKAVISFSLLLDHFQFWSPIPCSRFFSARLIVASLSSYAHLCELN